jgi:hypothetical protein
MITIVNRVPSLSPYRNWTPMCACAQKTKKDSKVDYTCLLQKRRCNLRPPIWYTCVPHHNNTNTLTIIVRVANAHHGGASDQLIYMTHTQTHTHTHHHYTIDHWSHNDVVEAILKYSMLQIITDPIHVVRDCIESEDRLCWWRWCCLDIGKDDDEQN